jgi:RNA polymerase sigma factor (sigma-70 family)
VAERAEREQQNAELDDRLMTAVQEGDVSRMGVLFERHHHALFNFFLRLTGDRQASEDMVQDVFLRMLKYRATYRPGSQFRTWMYHLARNIRIDRARARPPEVELDTTVHDPPTTSVAPSEKVDRDEQVALLRRAMARLPDDKRELLVLSRFQGLKYEQVGELLGCEVGAVKVRVHRAVRALRSIVIDLTGEQTTCSANS